MLASKVYKPQPLLRLNPYHACIKPAHTSPTPASESLSCVHQTCTNLTHSWFWILIMHASNLHNPHAIPRLNCYHACIKPAKTSPTPAFEPFSCVHQTCTNLTHSCVWILLIHILNLHKPQPLLRLNPSRASIDLQKPHPLLRLNPSLACIKMHKPHPLLCLNLSLTRIKTAKESPAPASESFLYKHQICTNLAYSCVWILLIKASNLQKPHPLLRLNPSLACIKHAKTSPTPVSESFSYTHQNCENITRSCLWILLIHASNLRKLHPVLRLNP